MFEVSKSFRFEASHVLPDHSGKCSRLHGHSWIATVTMRGYELHQSGSQRGMLVDFGIIKKYMEPIVDGVLDHHHLNDTLPVYPTSENVAGWLWGELRSRLPVGLREALVSIRVEETCTSACTYFPDGSGELGRA
ncbi:MAG: 6-carboxytetrahydropterin synthase QueD [Acidobacteria bacterium RBG_16_68_9]|nr:MAG: 6-carboxytetrahydropterin synthase QueD [Acidobacteria bacterium RBG_16_68_9]